jgi:hypothetical protein
MAEQAVIYKFQCAQCGVAVARKYRGSGTKPTLCSNSCKVAAYRQRNPCRVKASRVIEAAKRHPTVRVRHCSCGVAIGPYKRSCKDCYSLAQLERASSNKCNSCGDKVGKGRQRCEPCREVARFLLKQSPSTLANKRKCKARRKAVERGAYAEKFDPLDIFQRDRWRCYICGCHTPKALRGTYAPNAPELDHIIAIAAGGQHTKDNVACSCRRCNGLKSDRPLEAMLKAA